MDYKDLESKLSAVQIAQLRLESVKCLIMVSSKLEIEKATILKVADQVYNFAVGKTPEVKSSESLQAE